MAGQINDIIDILDGLTINCSYKSTQMNNKIRLNSVELDEIMKACESIFTWNIYKEIDQQNQKHTLSVFNKVQDECESFCGNTFNLKKFSLQLILCYELYINGNYEKSLQEIENVVKFLGSCKFDDDHNQYSYVYNHIARATYAYVALTMDLDFVTILENVKPRNAFERKEVAAAYVVKAYVFMQYTPVGNDIGLKLVDQARALEPDILEWLVVWLTAKQRIRQYFIQFSMPDKCEIEAADMLLHVKNQKASFMIKALEIYANVGRYYRHNSQLKESNKYYQIASDIVTKVMPLLGNNIHYLNSIFSILIYFPKKFQSKSLFKELVEKLKITDNGYVYQLLGKYYYRVEQDYETAKMYLSRKMETCTFGQVIELLRVECGLHSIDQFPFIVALNKIYDAFPSPIQRLTVTKHMLMYYYYKNESKEFMRCLKLYLDQNVDDALKNWYLFSAYSLPNFPVRIREFQFLNMIKIYVERIESDNNEWTSEEKTIFNDTQLRFTKLSRVDINVVESIGSRPKFLFSKSDNEHTVNTIDIDKQKPLQQYGLNEKPGSWRKRDGSLEHQAMTPNDLRECYRPGNESNNFSGRQNMRKIINCSWRNQLGGRVPKVDEKSTANADLSQFQLKPRQNTEFS